MGVSFREGRGSTTMAGLTETMSATPNNSGTAWGPAPAPPNTVSPTPTLPPPSDSSRDTGRNALQALLAFACIHEQSKRRRLKSGQPESARFTKEEEFALDEVLQLVADRAYSITGASGVAIALAEDNAVICRASTGEVAPDRGARIDPNSGFSGACLRSGQTVRCDDSETDTRVNAQACRALGTRSMVAVPLSAKQRVIGLVEAFSSETYGFNDADVRSLNLLAELILAAIRPAEEDRLAELSKRIVVPAPAPPIPSETATVSPHAPSRILVDEFLPPPARSPKTADAKTEPSPPAAMPAGEPTPPAVEPSLVRAESAVSPEPVSLKPEEERQPIARVLSTVAAILVAGLLLWALIWKVKHVEQVSSANTQPSLVTVKEADGETVKVVPTAPLDVKSGANPEVTGIRHWSVSDSSTVVVDLEDQVEYEAHALDNPPRMYFDLHDTRLAAGLANQSLDVNDDPFLKRIRMAQPVDGITRVVLETKREGEFSFKLERDPYRLTIVVHKPGATAVPENIPAPPAKPSPAVAPRKTPSSPGTSSSALRIVLDAGHGGWDLGTVGRKGLLEKDLTLDITERVGTLLEENLRAQVTYTRTDDSYLPLEKRAEIANLARADLFVSVHANYSDLATARGVETYYTNTYSSVKARTDGEDPALKQVNWTGVDIRAKVTDSHRLASDIQQALYDRLRSRNPDIRNRGVKEAQYVVLTGTQMPAVLAEVSFVSSPADEDKLQSSEYRQHIAEALFNGIARYRDDMKATKVVSATN